MNLQMHFEEINAYHSETQRVRVLTENWVGENLYCPRCGNEKITHFQNNRPVADFYCEHCKNEFELKSKGGELGDKVNDGAYDTMIARITSNQNPDFLFMSYQKQSMIVKDLVIVPKHFFMPSMIEKRRPLSVNARRAGWVGCNILLHSIPQQGFIKIIENGNVIDKEKVLLQMSRSSNLKLTNIEARGWLFDILECVNLIPMQEFSLDDIYYFEPFLAIKHSNNHNIKPKIRQQLQYLRDKGFLEFTQRGKYKKIY